MRIIDTHMHLFYLKRFRYRWLDGDAKIERAFPVETYLSEAERAGIEKMLYVEADVVESQIESEIAFAAGLDDRIAGIIAACRPESSHFPEFVERALGVPKVRGFRRILHTLPDDYSEAPLFVENVRRLAGLGTTFDLCVLARQLGAAARLARACPDVGFVLDHCGIPPLRDGQLDEWRRGIDLIASLPNVACKISGVIAYGDPVQWTIDDLRPVIEHVVERFGWDRVVWGSDWPVCTKTASLTGWVNVSREIFASCTEDEKTALFRGNAQAIYGLDH